MSKSISDQLNDVQEDVRTIKTSIEKMKADLNYLIKTVGDLSGQIKNLNVIFEKNADNRLKTQFLEKNLINQKISSIPKDDMTINEKSPAITQTTIAEKPIVMAYPAPSPSKAQKHVISTQQQTQPEPKQEIQTKTNDPKQIFDAIVESAKNNTFARELGKMIDSARSEISKLNSLNPILFELSMEAGRLKIMGEKSLNQDGIEKLEELINKWKRKA
jgi:hypothetical protein